MGERNEEGSPYGAARVRSGLDRLLHREFHRVGKVGSEMAWVIGVIVWGFKQAGLDEPEMLAA